MPQEPLSDLNKAEAVKALRQLAQSSGWALLRTQWQQLVQLRETEKAVCLRKGESGTYLQGKVDGICETAGSLDMILKQLTVEPEEPPTY